MTFNYTPTETAKIRIDIETNDCVIEGGKDKRSSLDSVQQVVFASILSGKKPAVAIYDTRMASGANTNTGYGSVAKSWESVISGFPVVK